MLGLLEAVKHIRTMHNSDVLYVKMDTSLDLLILAVILISTVVTAALVLLVIRRYLERLSMRTETKLDDYLVNMISGPLSAFIIATGVVVALRYWDSRFPGTLPAWVVINFDGFNSALIILIVTTVAAFIISNIVVKRIKSITDGKPEQETAFHLVNRILVGLIYFLGGMAALSALFPWLWGSLTTLLFGAGFLGIILGLAAQKTIGNFLSGVNINITRPIRMEDAVVIRGEYGVVEDITLRHTIIRTWDNRQMIIPNAVLDEEIIINYTLKDEKKLFPVVVSVPYDTNVEQAKEIIVSAAKKHPNVLQELEPIFQVLDFAEGAITLRLLFLAKNQPTAFGTACDLRFSIKKQFDDAGIRISCPTRYIVKPKEHQE
jgi:small conductance mechanosensitive channel